MLKRRLIALVSAIVMLASLIPLAALPATAEMGGDSPWTKEQTLVEEILERDGFIDGVWYPWLFAAKNGRSLCGNKVMAQFHGEEWATAAIDEMGADVVYRGIYNLKTMGYNMMAYGGSMYGEGVIFDQYGDVLGVEQEYLDNMRRFLDICRAAEMPVMWNIYFHASTVPEYFSSQTWNFLSQMIANPTISRHFAERYVTPVCEVLAEYPDVVAMVSIADEPENEINDSEKGKHFSGGRSCYGTTVENMRNFLWEINETVKEKLPGMPRTVASNDQNKTLYRDFALDLMGHNRYDNMSNAPTVDAYVTYADMIMAEYNVGDAFPGGDEALAETLIRYRQNMMDRGYKGGFQWCWLPNHVAGSSHYLIVDPTDNTAFRETVALLRYFMNDYRAAHRGETVGLEPAVLYANSDDGQVQWIPSRQGVTVDILRTDDGKSWFTVAKGVEQSPLVDMGKAVYRDTTQKPDSGYIYKVITYDADGNYVESAPNDPAGTAQTFVRESKTPVIDYPTNTKYEKAILTKKDQADLISFGVENNRVYRPELNLIENGSFEELSGDAGQWCNRDFLCEYLGLVDDNTHRYQVPDGNSCLMLDTRQVPDGLWRKFTVKGLEKNTDYVFSVWVKGDYLGERNACDASIGVIDPDTGTFMVYWDYYRGNARASRHTEQIYPPCWDNQWHLRSVMFNSGDHTSCEIGLYGAGSVMYVDDMQLFKNGDGIKYTAGKNDNIGTKFLWDEVSCVPADSLFEDVTVDGEDFWQTGDGWKQGFMSIAESKYGHGSSLKYTESADPHGLYYLKWIDVKPNTKYYVSFDFKIQKSGAGRIVLMDNQLLIPREFYTIDLDAEIYGTDWFRYSGEFNSGAHEMIAFGVLDQGGEALIDNIRLFEAADNAPAVKDLYTYTNKVTNNVAYGKIASVTARAEGDGLKYAWYYKNKGASQFTKTTSVTGKTYSVAMDKSRDGRQVYCVITDKYGVSRKTATTTLTVKKSTPKITTQPKTVTYAKYGETAKVTVKATGDGLKYTWYIKNDGASKYSKSSVTSATYSVKMADKVHGRRLYCVITDAWGKKLQTKTVQVRMAATITTQPKTVTVKKNATAKLTIKAKGEGLKYTWYVKNAGSKKYTKSSVTKSTYSVKMTGKVNGRYVYCVVTDKYGKKVQSKTVRVKMK